MTDVTSSAAMTDAQVMVGVADLDVVLSYSGNHLREEAGAKESALHLSWSRLRLECDIAVLKATPKHVQASRHGP